MTHEEYNKLTKELQNRGYRKHPSPHSGDCGWYKSFGESAYEEGRSNYQVCFDVYDFGKYADRESYFKTNPYGVERWVLVSRSVNERIDLLLSPSSELDIDEIERLAESFYKWTEKEVEA